MLLLLPLHLTELLFLVDHFDPLSRPSSLSSSSAMFADFQLQLLLLLLLAETEVDVTLFSHWVFQKLLCADWTKLQTLNLSCPLVYL